MEDRADAVIRVFSTCLAPVLSLYDDDDDDFSAPTMNTWKLAAFPKTLMIKFKGVLLDPLAESSNVRFHGRCKIAPFLCRRVKKLFH